MNFITFRKQGFQYIVQRIFLRLFILPNLLSVLLEYIFYINTSDRILIPYIGACPGESGFGEELTCLASSWPPLYLAKQRRVLHCSRPSAGGGPWDLTQAYLQLKERNRMPHQRQARLREGPGTKTDHIFCDGKICRDY